MDLIASNPFYVLGLTANASERVIQKQVATISAYARVGRSVESEVDFPVLSLPVRNEQNVNLAVSKIEQPADRMYHSLFWFINATHIDKTALGYLRNDDAAKAAEIWELALKGKSLGPKNFSAAHNLSTLQFLFAFSSGSVNRKVLLPAIRLKGKLFADCFDELSRAVVGEKVSVDHRELSRRFASAFLRDDSLVRGGIQGLIAAFEDFPQETRTYIEGRISSGPSARIRRAIESAEARREKHPKQANDIGLELYEASRDDLDIVRDVHGRDHPQFQVIANDLANEILQCSIDYFNEYIESDIVDPGEDASYLLRIARSIGPSGAVKHRLDENAQIIESWQNESTDRSNARNLEKAINQIISKLKWLDNGPISSQRASEMLHFSKAPLATIAAALGTKSEIYLRLCDSAAATALRVSVASINSFDDLIEQGRYDRQLFLDTFFRFTKEIAEASKTMSLLRSMDMSPELRDRCEENRHLLANIAREYRVSTHREEGRVRTGNAGRPTAEVKEAPIFTAPLSDSPGLISSFWALIAASPRTLGAVIVLLGLVSLCGVIRFNVPENSFVSGSNSNRIVTVANNATTPSGTASASPTPKVERPETGTEISKGATGRGLGALTISNGTSNDAIAKLVSVSTGKTFKEVYIRANSSMTIKSVSSGMYELFFSTGRNYAPSIGKFLNDASYSKFDDTFDFRQTRDSYGVNYRDYRVSLDKVSFGNASTSSIDESSFISK